jgi:uncharacterized membrane protein
VRKQFVGRVAIGVLAASPLSVVAVVLSVIVFGFQSATIPLGAIVIGVAITTVIMQAGVIGYFLYLVHTDPALDAAGKSRWTYILVMWLPFGAIAYWYQFVWRNRDDAPN